MAGMSRLLVARGFPRHRGRIETPRLWERVEVLRDRWGIAHIFAANSHDLLAAQGFTHAQDRLWQMEETRRYASGRLAELGGEELAPLDLLIRITGMPGLKSRAMAALTDEELDLCRAYADGVNDFIESAGNRLPLEFRSLGIRLEPWTVEDCASFLAFLSWNLSFGGYAAKLLALVRGADLTLAEWDDLFPSSPGERLPPDPWFDLARRIRLGSLRPVSLAMHGRLEGPRAGAEVVRRTLATGAPCGSNNWAAARSSDGLPILANDPHLPAGLPPTWYFCGLHCPGIDAVGASAPGTPGIVIGRNRRAAWGVTNVMLDVIDVLVLRVDPSSPTRYRMADRWMEMDRERVSVGLPKGRSISFEVLKTVHGPVLTEVEPGVDAVATLKWYGTLAEPPADRSLALLHRLLRAGSAAEVLEAGRGCRWVAQNFVAADVDGHIGWEASGAAPLRRGYSGRLPADASAGADWTGYLEPDRMPASFDPAEGWIATANHKTTDGHSPHPLSYYWTGPWRLMRIAETLRSLPAPGVEDFRRLQADVHSMVADRIVPKVLAFPLHDLRAREAAGILAEWDREVTADSRGAAVWEAFLTAFERMLVAGRLGDDFCLYLTARLIGMAEFGLERAGSSWWNGRKPGAVVEQALSEAMGMLERRLGVSRERWSWGRLHRYVFRHRGSRPGLASLLLDPTPVPAGGDCTTVNASWYLPLGEDFAVTGIPSLRLIAPLGDVDGTLVIGPLGQSGQPGHRHYDDLNERWAAADPVALPLSRAAVEAIAADRLELAPHPRSRP